MTGGSGGTDDRADDPADDPAEPTCSARGCRAPARWVLAWNNPKIHPPQRRKQWTACPEHRDSLAAFLRARAMLREVDPL